MARGSRIRGVGGEEPGVDGGDWERQEEVRKHAFLLDIGRREAEQGRLTKNMLRNLPKLLVHFLLWRGLGRNTLVAGTFFAEIWNWKRCYEDLNA